MKQWLIGAAIKFALRQIGKWGTSIDWPKVKADFAIRVRDLVPGEMLDDEAVAAAMAVIDIFASILGDQSALQKIVQLVLDGKISEALVLLRDLIIQNFKFPGNVADAVVDELLACLPA